MKFIYTAGLCGLLLLSTAQVLADHVIFSGEFDGTELTAQEPLGICAGPPLGYDKSEPFQVSVSGDYQYADASVPIDIDMLFAVYQGSYDPSNPSLNLVAAFDDAGVLALQTGTNYIAVAQTLCSNDLGVWIATLSGPGAVSGASVVQAPDYTLGNFDGSEARINTACGNTFYDVNGPIQYPVAGNYFYADAGIQYDVDICIAFYRDSFDPANPDQNRVALFDDGGSVTLEEGVNYFIVTQSLNIDSTGEWHYVLAPPAPFELNPDLNGSWFNKDTSGQGFFLDVFPKIKLVFLAWFTYDTTQPDGSVTPVVGHDGHRWLTAQGNYNGTSVDLDVTLTTGGTFDTAGGASNSAPGTYGSMTLEFTDCSNGSLDYSFIDSGLSGSVPLSRLAKDNVAECEARFSDTLTAISGYPE